MKLAKRMTWLLTTAVISMIIMTGCKKAETTTDSELPNTLESITSQTVASNDTYSLEWSQEKSCVLLKQQGTDKVWSTIPYDFYPSETPDEDMNSPIYIQYVDGVSMVSITDKGYSDCVKNGRVASKQIENGIEVTYYFDESGISVPLQYVLREDALAVTVDFSRVQEGDNKLLSVSVAPFLCSVTNSAQDAYLVVPSGSGALMYADERAEDTRIWSGEIYGDDVARLLPENLTENEKVRLPFFGVKEGQSALLAIVEAGSEAAVITANAGNKTNGHSNAYVSFYARGFDISESQTAWAMNDVYRTEETISVEQSTVAFYPMNGEDADYVQMAQFYREYMEKAKEPTESAKEQPYALYVTGGAQIQELVLGVPVNKTKALTTYQQVEQMLEELTKQTGKLPEVQLRGFGETGLDPGKVAGGFDFAKVFGSDKERLALEAYCAEADIALFTDFDLVYFRSGGKGVNTLLNAAKSASSRKIKLYYKDKALWHYDEDEAGYFLVGRGKLQDLMAQLKETVDAKEISGVSLSTLGQYAYSDYSEAQYAARGNIETDVKEYLTQLREAGTKVATQSANAYAAMLSDTVFEVPTGSGDFLSLDADIPLYQIVFRGSAALYSTAINTTENFRQSVVRAVASGTSLGFSVVGEYDARFASTPYVGLNASSYEGNQAAIAETVAKCADYYTAIQGQTISDYELISENVTKTTYANGVVVYVNHDSEPADSPVGQLEAYGFSYTSEGK